MATTVLLLQARLVRVLTINGLKIYCFTSNFVDREKHQNINYFTSKFNLNFN